MTLSAGDWPEVGGTSFLCQGPGMLVEWALPPHGWEGLFPHSLTLTAFVDVCGDLHSRV